MEVPDLGDSLSWAPFLKTFLSELGAKNLPTLRDLSSPVLTYVRGVSRKFRDFFFSILLSTWWKILLNLRVLQDCS